MANKPLINMKTCVVGLGYIGLPTAATIAQSGQSVIGLEIDKDIVDIVNCGNVHIVETGLERSVKIRLIQDF